MKDKEIDCICTQQVRAEIAYDFRWHTEECLIYNRKKARADTAREIFDFLLKFKRWSCTSCCSTVLVIYQDDWDLFVEKYLKSEGEKELNKIRKEAIIEQEVKINILETVSELNATGYKTYHKKSIQQEKRIKELEDVLKSVIRFDKTPEYGYGTTHEDMNNDGKFPPEGERWLTPREIAKKALKKEQVGSKSQSDLGGGKE